MKRKKLAVDALIKASETCVQERDYHFTDSEGNPISDYAHSDKVSAVGVLYSIIPESLAESHDSIFRSVQQYFDFSNFELDHIDHMTWVGKRTFLDIARHIERNY